MKKIIFSIIFMIILSFSVLGIDLIDSENFDEYSLTTSVYTPQNLFTESNGKWNCSDSINYPSCISYTGSGYIYSNFSIESRDYTTNNNFLRLWAIGEDDSNYATIGLKFNNTYYSGSGENYSISYDIRLFDYSNDFVTDKAYAGIYFGGSFFVPPNSYLFEHIGGIDKDYEENITSIRTAYNFFSGTPAESNDCSINDGAWHTVTVHYINNGGSDNTIVRYLDGLECYSASSSLVINNLNLYLNDFIFYAKGEYDIGIDNLNFYADGLYEPILNVEGIKNCPSESCLFYDDFNYGSPSPTYLEIAGYTGELDSLYTTSSELRFNGSTSVYPQFYHNLETDIYDEIEGYIILNLNYDETPDSFESTPYTLLYTMSCGNYDIHNINLAFIKDYDFTLSNYSTVLHFYSSDTGQNLGTYTIDNDNTVAIRVQYNDVEKKYKFTVEQDKLLTSIGFPQSSDFSVDYNIKNCDDFSKISMKRRDYRSNDSTDDYIGIDEIWLYGISTPTTTEDTEEFENVTKVVENDVGDKTKEVVYSLGFRSLGARILLVLAVILGMLAIANADFKENFKIIAPFIIVSIFLIAFYLGILPLELLIFIILIVAGFLAFFITNMFKRSE